MRAIEGSDVDLVYRFLQIETINVNIQSATGTTALHIAAALGQINIVQSLLDHGVKVDLEDIEGNTALILAEQLGHQGVTSLLQK